MYINKNKTIIDIIDIVYFYCWPSVSFNIGSWFFDTFVFIFIFLLKYEYSYYLIDPYLKVWL